MIHCCASLVTVLDDVHSSLVFGRAYFPGFEQAEEHGRKAHIQVEGI
jgi:hypothetical protein